MKRPLITLLAVLLLIVAGAGLLIGNGGDGESADASERDRAFLVTMVPHHESAIWMAGMARQRASTPEIRGLSEDILRTQQSEIALMRRIHQRLFGEPLESDPGAHEVLGLSASEAGMEEMDHGMAPAGGGSHAEGHGMGAWGPADAKGSSGFDLAFISHMVPHHEGAVAMSRAVLETTKDPAIRKLARKIISAQEREIELMRMTGIREFGSPAVAGSNGTAVHGSHHQGHAASGP